MAVQLSSNHHGLYYLVLHLLGQRLVQWFESDDVAAAHLILGIEQVLHLALVPRLPTWHRTDTTVPPTSDCHGTPLMPPSSLLVLLPCHNPLSVSPALTCHRVDRSQTPTCRLPSSFWPPPPTAARIAVTMPRWPLDAAQ